MTDPAVTLDDYARGYLDGRRAENARVEHEIRAAVHRLQEARRQSAYERVATFVSDMGKVVRRGRVPQTPPVPEPAPTPIAWHYPPPGEEARRIVRHGMADVLAWLGETPGPAPSDPYPTQEARQ